MGFSITGRKSKDVETERHIHTNDHDYNDQFEYANNYIKTSKYNVVTFLPKNLFEQFQRLANFYFLVLMILQLIPWISSLTAWTTIVPLIGVLAVSALKDLVDDIQRHKNDEQVNNRKSYVIRDGKLVEEKWRYVEVGDIIRLENDHHVTADLLLLSTSEPHGLCYVETAELDGETNLKAKQALVCTSKLGDDIKKISRLKGEIVCEPPNNRLNTFNGKILIDGEQLSLDNEKMLLRGCVLRNTKWCYGLVIFAGRDTKLMQNSGKTKFKRTSLDRFLNLLIIGIVIFLLSICLICTILCGIWELEIGQYFTIYVPWDPVINPFNSQKGKIAFIAFLSFFSYAILCNTVVPISLYVSVEIIRFAHSWFINWDSQMYDEASDSPARSRTTTLNEELGQIQYIFSDKTGTLTQNIMAFNRCSINGTVYGYITDTNGNVTEDSETTVDPIDLSQWNKWAVPKFKWYDERLVQDVQKHVSEVETFWRLLALCHTVIAETKNESLEYQAQSPDEEALVTAARSFGFVFKSRTPNSITIEVDGKEEEYELLCILDFNNYRKRMSVLVRRMDRIMLFCKGADTVVLERVDSEGSSGALKTETQVHLDRFANDGLRTLVVAWKEVSPEFYVDWSKRHHAASISLDNRVDKLDAVYEEIERDMMILGATAIEDKLQDGVPETIANLASANIKIWVLTGDKQETAINIGYLCHLLTENMQEIFIVDAETCEEVTAQLHDIKAQIEAAGLRVSDDDDGDDDANSKELDVKKQTSYEVNGAIRNNNPRDKTTRQLLLSSNQHKGCSGFNNDDGEDDDHYLEGFGLVINGHSLIHALDPSLEQIFLQIGCSCRAVICCRVTPLQKAQVVNLIKRNKKAVTLSIGDGANDVSMIKTAHIGVGISGQEGMQAVLASDFSIAQFRFLERLLLVHGRWSYFRLSKFLRYFFYKNFAFTLAHFWFAFFCGYTALTMYDPTFIAFYNLFFTALPVLALGIFDQDVNDTFSIRHPKLYIPGQYNLYFNMRIFVYSVLHGIISSLCLFFIPYGALIDAEKPGGYDLNGHQVFGFTVFTSLVVVVTMQIALDTAYWTVLSHVVIWGSLMFYFLVAVIYYEAIPGPLVPNAGIAFVSMSSVNFWLIILLATVTLMVPVIAMRFFWFDTHPTLSDRVRVKQNYQRLTTRLSEFALKPLRSVTRRRIRSRRSGYAFSHRGGFGDLITEGIIMRENGENMVEQLPPGTIMKMASSEDLEDDRSK